MANGQWLYDLAQKMGAAQTHGMVPSAGHSVLGDSAQVAAASSAPVLSPGVPPALPMADQPVAPTLAPPPGGLPEGYPPIGSPAHELLVNHFAKQSAESAKAAEDARAFIGPGGPVDQLQLGSLDKLRQAGDIMQAATEKQGQAQTKVDHAESERLAQNQRADEIRMRKREAMVRDYQDRADVLSEQAQNMEVRDFWADKSTGSRILGILAQTLSGAANGLAGNPGAPSPLDRIIDRDLEIQRSNMQNKRLAADRAQNALAHVYQGFQQEDASVAAYRLAAAEWYKAKSNELASQFNTDTASAKNLQVQAAADQTIADSKAKLAKTASDAHDLLHRAADDNLVQLERDASNERQMAMSRDDQQVTLPGVDGFVRKSMANSQWAKISQGFGGAFANLDNIERKINKPGVSLADSIGADASAALLKGDVRGILGTGANLSAEESKDLNSLVVRYLKQKGVNSISELGAPDSRALIGQIRLSLARTWQSRVRSTHGRELARNNGFESAYDAIAADDAQQTANQ